MADSAAHPRRTAPLLSVLVALAAFGCQTPAAPPASHELAGIHQLLDALYESFCFEVGGEADWEGMRVLFAEGAAFVAPITDAAPPRAVGAETFLADFRAWSTGTAVSTTGLHERIVHARVDVFGAIAHAYVTFEGFVPPDGPATTRGVDSIQLVRDGGRWLVASFTSQFENAELPLPARFLR